MDYGVEVYNVAELIDYSVSIALVIKNNYFVKTMAKKAMKPNNFVQISATYG